MPLSSPTPVSILPATPLVHLRTVNTKDAVTTAGPYAALAGFNNAIILAEYINNAAASAANQPVVNIGKTGSLAAVYPAGLTLNYKNPDAATAWKVCTGLTFYVPLVANGFDYFITGTYGVGDSFDLYFMGSF